MNPLEESPSLKNNPALDLFEAVKSQYEELLEEVKKDGQDVKLECDTGTQFGIVRVAAITACKVAPLIRMQVQREDKSQSLVLIVPSRCSFMFTPIPASTEREPVGFVIKSESGGKITDKT